MAKKTLFKNIFSKLLEENSRAIGFGPVYHGGGWDGLSPIKIAGRGALGAGAYFSPIRSVAEKYAREQGGVVIEAFLDISNQLEIRMKSGTFKHPCVDALIQLGLDPEIAFRKVEKIEENKGYLGKEISTLALAKGYDALFQYFDGTLKEIVIWNSNKVLRDVRDLNSRPAS